MSKFYENECYQITNSPAAFITFHLDEHHRRAFNAHQLISFALDPNPEAETENNEPPQKLVLQFATADVIILGWRLDCLAEKLADHKLTALGLLPKRYADLDRSKVFVANINIAPVGEK